MTPELPRPCRYDDLSRASAAGNLTELALIVDGTPQALTEAISAWRAVLPRTRLIVFHTQEYVAAVRAFAKTGQAIISRPISSYQALCNDTQALTSEVWASCAPYDAYGELIKTDLESIVYEILDYTDGLYLAHDPAFSVVRWFDASGIRDRLRYRGIRLQLYRWVCRIVHGFAWLSSRFSASRFKWHKV